MPGFETVAGGPMIPQRGSRVRGRDCGLSHEKKSVHPEKTEAPAAAATYRPRRSTLPRHIRLPTQTAEEPLSVGPRQQLGMRAQQLSPTVSLSSLTST